MTNIAKEILEFIEEDKKMDIFEYELDLLEIAELEKDREEFVHAVGKIIGSCEMSMNDDGVVGCKTLTIIKTRG